MIIGFSIHKYDRDDLRAYTDEELRKMFFDYVKEHESDNNNNDEDETHNPDIVAYLCTETFLEDLNDQTVDADGYWWVNARSQQNHKPVFTVTFTYETLLSKTRHAVECETEEEMREIASDVSSLASAKFVRMYPCKRPCDDGCRMTAREYREWVYGKAE